MNPFLKLGIRRDGSVTGPLSRGPGIQNLAVNHCRWLLLVLLAVSLWGCSWLRKTDHESDARTRQLIEIAQHAEDKGDLKRAAEVLKRAAQENPTDPHVHRKLGRILLTQGNAAAALELLQFAAAKNPDDPSDHLELARALRALKRDDEAEKAVNDSLALEPDFVEALVFKADLVERQHRLDLALETYYRVLAIKPNHVDAQVRIAAIQLASGKAGQAAVLLRSVCGSSATTEEEKANALSALGMSYGKQRRWGDAVVGLYEANQIRGNTTADDWYRLAYARFRNGDARGAWQDLEVAVSRQSDHPPSLAMATVLQSRTQRLPRRLPHRRYSMASVPTPAGW